MKQDPSLLSISSKLLFEEASKRGIKSIFFDKFTVEMKKKSKNWFIRGSLNSFQSAVGRTIAKKKELAKTILNYHSIPQANYQVIKTLDNLTKINKLNFPLVLKPSQGTQGKNVFVGINNMNETKKKIQELYLDDENFAIFEEMLQGKEYRILCIDFKFVAAAYRTPANIIGDGKHTIQKLIEIKNQHPWRGEGHQSPLTKIAVDQEVINNLKEIELNLDSVPEKDQQVFLRKVGNLSQGGEAINVTHLVSEANQQLFEKIARVTDLNVIGIDVMCQSLETPIINQQNAGIIEINAAPGLRMHHFPMQGDSINAAGLILDMIENEFKKRGQ